MFDLAALREAAEFVHQHIPATAQHAWPLLAARLGCEVWVKHENHAPTGAFKVRGGLVYVRSLLACGNPPQGLVTATRGNHGQSMAMAARRAGLPLVIVVPEGNSREKNAAMRALGAELVEHGADFDVAREEASRKNAKKSPGRCRGRKGSRMNQLANRLSNTWQALPSERLSVPQGCRRTWVLMPI